MEPIFEGYQPVETGHVGCYIIRHVPTGKFYVGSTGDVKYRLRKHRESLARGDNSNRSLQALYDEHPHFKVEFYLTGKSDNKDERDSAFTLEQDYVTDHWGSELLLNDCPDVRLPYTPNGHTPEANLKRALSLKIAYSNAELKKRQTEINRDRRRSKRERERQSVISKSFWEDPAMRAKILERKHSPEAMAKSKAKQLAKWQDPQYRSEMAEKRSSEEYREKLRQANAKRSKVISINGVQYRSLMEASRQLMIRQNTIRARVNSDKHPNYFFV